MAKDGEKGAWTEFLWNPRTREFLGRTASSWGEYRPATQQCSKHVPPPLPPDNRSVSWRTHRVSDCVSFIISSWAEVDSSVLRGGEAVAVQHRPVLKSDCGTAFCNNRHISLPSVCQEALVIHLSPPSAQPTWCTLIYVFNLFLKFLTTVLSESISLLEICCCFPVVFI